MPADVPRLRGKTEPQRHPADDEHRRTGISTAHSAQKIRRRWQLGALFAIPAGQSAVVGDKIPYLAGSAETSVISSARGWSEVGSSETSAICSANSARRTCPIRSQIFTGELDRDILMAYMLRDLSMRDLPDRITRSRRSTPGWVVRTAAGKATRSVVVTTGIQRPRAQLDRAGNHFSFIAEG